MISLRFLRVRHRKVKYLKGVLQDFSSSVLTRELVGEAPVTYTIIHQQWPLDNVQKEVGE